MKSKCNVNLLKENEISFLFVVCVNGNGIVIKKLIEKGVNINDELKLDVLFCSLFFIFMFIVISNCICILLNNIFVLINLFVIFFGIVCLMGYESIV